MTAHCQMPSKTKPRFFISCLNRTNDRAKFDYWDGKKTYCSPSPWSDDMDIETMEVFQNSHFGNLWSLLLFLKVCIFENLLTLNALY